MAHLKTLATNNNLAKRAEWKWILTQKLYQRGLANKDIVKIFNIIDKMMTLSKQLQAELTAKIKRFEEERQMPLISPTIELAREQGQEEGLVKGREQGREEGKLLQTQQIVKRLLKRRVGEIDTSLRERIDALPIEVLEELTEALLDFSSVTDLEQWLQNRR